MPKDKGKEKGEAVSKPEQTPIDGVVVEASKTLIKTEPQVEKQVEKPTLITPAVKLAIDEANKKEKSEKIKFHNQPKRTRNNDPGVIYIYNHPGSEYALAIIASVSRIGYADVISKGSAISTAIEAIALFREVDTTALVEFKPSIAYDWTAKSKMKVPFLHIAVTKEVVIVNGKK